ncbi:MAG TPA: shikimate dehydrogenase [Thermomicrobiales bacterium]|nr:shikimate dehydrogenase [Thermomicrobiales bacterium]
MNERPRRLRVGVIGDPVAHSLSPALHQPALDALGVPATFERWRTTAADLPGRIAGLRAADALGASVTVPHKVAVMSLVDEVAPAARRAGAVNTVVNRDGALIGDNTDIHGFATSLAGACSDVATRPALLLGAGGAARAVALALESLGVPEIALANRDPARAARLAADLAVLHMTTVPFDEATLRRRLPETRLLVNCTSLGWKAGETPMALDLLALLPDDALVADLTYRQTDLLQAAANRDLPTLDGLGMLVHQGAKAFALWTGRAAPVDAMFAAAWAARDANA